MAERLARLLLKEHLGEFLQDVDSEQICVGVNRLLIQALVRKS